MSFIPPKSHTRWDCIIRPLGVDASWIITNNNIGEGFEVGDHLINVIVGTIRAPIKRQLRETYQIFWNSALYCCWKDCPHVNYIPCHQHRGGDNICMRYSGEGTFNKCGSVHNTDDSSIKMWLTETTCRMMKLRLYWGPAADISWPRRQPPWR